MWGGLFIQNTRHCQQLDGWLACFSVVVDAESPRAECCWCGENEKRETRAAEDGGTTGEGTRLPGPTDLGERDAVCQETRDGKESLASYLSCFAVVFVSTSVLIHKVTGQFCSSFFCLKKSTFFLCQSAIFESDILRLERVPWVDQMKSPSSVQSAFRIHSCYGGVSNFIACAFWIRLQAIKFPSEIACVHH